MNFSRGVGGSLSHLWKFRRGGGAISSLEKWKIQGAWGLDTFWNYTFYHCSVCSRKWVSMLCVTYNNLQIGGVGSLTGKGY